jgi:hypothetical protein
MTRGSSLTVSLAAHANKRGARYRYYVSQAVLQGKPPPPGLVSRVPAAEIEALAVAALRNHLNARNGGEGLHTDASPESAAQTLSTQDHLTPVIHKPDRDAPAKAC